MALRSLLVKLKALPRRIPRSNAFAPMDNPRIEIVAESPKYASVKEMTEDIIPRINQRAKRLQQEKDQKIMKIFHTLRLGFVSSIALYAVSLCVQARKVGNEVTRAEGSSKS